MQLKKFLEQEGAAQFGRSTGLSEVTLWRIATGRSEPRLLTANAIVVHSKGMVTFNDLVRACPGE